MNPMPPLPAEAATGSAGVVRRLRTFIVEDSAIILDNLVATLEELALVDVVASASDETSAMQQLRQLGTAVDLVIVDIFLKGGSGLGLLRRMTEEHMGAQRAVLTNYATQDMRQKCLALGASEVFDKSGDIDRLLDYCTGLAAARDAG